MFYLSTLYIERHARDKMYKISKNTSIVILCGKNHILRIILQYLF